MQNTLGRSVRISEGQEYGVAELVTVPEDERSPDAKLQEEMDSERFKKYNADEQRAFLVKCFRLDSSPFLQNPEDLWKAAEFLRRYWGSFAFDGKFGTTNIVQHPIDLKEGTRPIKCRYRPLPRGLEDSCNQQVDEWLQADVIEKSNSPWTSNLLAVRKKNNTYRWCVDWRCLNACTVKDSFPMPECTDCLSRLAGSRCFSTLDMKGAFHVVPIPEESRACTAFSTPRGLFQFKKPGFGLCNGPATYCRLVQAVLQGVPLSVCLPFMDDALVHSRTSTPT